MTTVLDLFITVVYFVLLLICPSGNYSSKKVKMKLILVCSYPLASKILIHLTVKLKFLHFSAKIDKFRRVRNLKCIEI